MSEGASEVSEPLSLTIPALSDYHLHLRQGDLVDTLAPISARTCGRVLVMPNTDPAIYRPDLLRAYKSRISHWMPETDVLMTFKILPDMPPSMVTDLAKVGAVAGKLYPAGATTNSQDGVSAEILRNPDNSKWLESFLDKMQEGNLVLCLHGEMPDEPDPLEREYEFLNFVAWVVDNYPTLRIVLEHITTRDAVNFISYCPLRVAATITLHHLMFHLGHVMGSASLPNGLIEQDGKLHPHLFCWPCAKRPSDRDALVKAVLSETPKFFLGSDSAPHDVYLKQSASCCAGVFTAPVLAQGLAHFFDSHNAIGKIEGFTSRFGDTFYRRKTIERRITLVRRPYVVPESIPGPQGSPISFVPFLAGKTLGWSVGE